jgi:predicted regulator of Ras-like GTPase activity (Roadblock/LC7/MglB family)
MWFASIVGALLFFLAGFMTATRRKLAAAAMQPALQPAAMQPAPQLAPQQPRVDPNPALQAEVEQLAEERDELRRRLEYFEGQVGQPTTSPVPLMVDLAATQFVSAEDRNERGTANILQSLLENIGGTEGVHSVAFADDLGLPIAGSGDHTESLAAFAGYIEDIANKSQKFLPMGKLRRITVEDINGEIVSACPMETGHSRIALVTLTVAPGPTTGNMTQLLQAAANIL